MASQDPSTAYTAAPEKPKSFFSSFPSFSLPKLPDFFGSTTPAAPAPDTAVAEQSSVQPGGRRRKGTKKAGRRRRHHRSRKGGLTPMEDIKLTDADIRYVTTGPKYDFPPTQVRKPTGKGRRTRRGGLTPAEDYKFSESEIRDQTRGTKAEFPPIQVRKVKGGRRTHRVKKHSRR